MISVKSVRSNFPISFSAKVSREWVIGHVRAGKDQVAREVCAVGFELLEDVPVAFLEENYMLRFGKVE